MHWPRGPSTTSGEKAPERGGLQEETLLQEGDVCSHPGGPSLDCPARSLMRTLRPASSPVGPWLSENEADLPAVWKSQAV